MNRRSWIGSFLLLVTVVSVGVGLAAWKYTSIQETEAASANQPEPMESVTVALAKEIEHRQTATSIGTVLALRSITLRNELPGTVRYVSLTPGQIVDTGMVLVALDVSVEEAELKAQEAQAALARAVLDRRKNLSHDRATTQEEVDRARADLDVALAQIARTKAIIARKTIRAPFRARVGMADVHPGQYLNEGTELTTLQGIDDAAHVDFTVAQQVAAGSAGRRQRRGIRRRPVVPDRSQDRRGGRAYRPHDSQCHGARENRGRRPTRRRPALRCASGFRSACHARPSLSPRAPCARVRAAIRCS